jgi:hypothetical protein
MTLPVERLKRVNKQIHIHLSQKKSQYLLKCLKNASHSQTKSFVTITALPIFGSNKFRDFLYSLLSVFSQRGIPSGDRGLMRFLLGILFVI